MAGQQGPNIDPNLSPDNALLQPAVEPEYDTWDDQEYETYRDDQGRLIRRKKGDPNKEYSRTGPTTPSDPNNLNVPNEQSGAGLEGTATGTDPLLPPPAPEYESVVAGEVDQIGPGPGIRDPRLPNAPQTDIGETQYKATTREVTPDELVENRLAGLLDSDSRYIRQARQQGLSMAGGLGGTSGIRAAVGAAIQAGLPIAEADAQAFRDAATQNMNALNDFGLANIQRTTQLQMANLDAKTRVQTTHMNNMTSTAIARLENATRRDIANLDARTKIKITELNGEIQGRLAELTFKNNTLLNDQLHGNRLEQISLGGEYDLERQAREIEAAQEAGYLSAATFTYDGALNRLAALDGLEMDDAARRRAEEAIWQGAQGQMDLIAILYPDAPHINFGPPGSDEGDLAPDQGALNPPPGG